MYKENYTAIKKKKGRTILCNSFYNSICCIVLTIMSELELVDFVTSWPL